MSFTIMQERLLFTSRSGRSDRHRPIIIVDTSKARVLFYKRTGTGDCGTPSTGAGPGDWAPFFGLHMNWMVKPSWEHRGSGLRRYGFQLLKDIGKSISIDIAKDGPWLELDEWALFNHIFHEAGVVGSAVELFNGVFVYDVVTEEGVAAQLGITLPEQKEAGQ